MPPWISHGKVVYRLHPLQHIVRAAMSSEPVAKKPKVDTQQTNQTKTALFIAKIREQYKEVADWLCSLPLNDDTLGSFSIEEKYKNNFVEVFDVKKEASWTPLAAADIANQFIWKKFQETFAVASVAGMCDPSARKQLPPASVLICLSVCKH